MILTSASICAFIKIKNLNCVPSGKLLMMVCIAALWYRGRNGGGDDGLIVRDMIVEKNYLPGSDYPTDVK